MIRVVLCIISCLLFSTPSTQPTCAFQIGDSLTVGAARYLSQFNVRSDGLKSRQWVAGISVARLLRQQGLLPHRVIVELGTNGPIDDSQFQAMLHAVGPRKIVFVTPYGPRWWIPPTARFITAEAKKYHQGVLRWDRLAADVGPDGIHLTRYDRFAYLTAHSIGCAT